MEMIDSPQANDMRRRVARLEIIFKDSDSSEKCNKELIAFLKNNIDALNRDNIGFVMQIVTQEEQKNYKSRGITSLPALVSPDGKVKYGVREIIRGIGDFTNHKKKLTSSMSNIGNGMTMVSDDALYEYQKKLIGTEKDGDNPEHGDDYSSSLRAKEQEMARRRQMAGMGSPMSGVDSTAPTRDNDYRVDLGKQDRNVPMNLNPADSLDRLKTGSGMESMDYDLMKKHLDKESPFGSMDYF